MTEPSVPVPHHQEPRLPGPGGAWVAAIIVVAISLLSTFTMASPDGDGTSTVQYVDPGTGEPIGEALTEGPSTESEDGTAGPSVRRVVRGGEGGEELVGGTAGEEGTEGSAGGGDGGGGQQSGAAGSYDCSRGENAGASDIGVSANEIRFGATVVKTGIAKDFLADAQFGIEAVVQKVNRQGGVCGRLIKVSYEDDEWKTDAGARIISKWIGEKQHFGLLVNPSSEGLRGALDGGFIEGNDFPVVGADGMLIGQYRSPWVWPVATSTYSVMHIMAKNAYQRGKAYWADQGQPDRKPSFAIVWENNYRFGVEGEKAFVEAIKRHCGGDCIRANQPIKGGELSYKNEANAFLNKCGSNFANCDFVAVLLEPATASQWVADNGLGTGEPSARPAVGIGAPQPLFVDSFIRDCGAPCSNMWVWTSFKPPIFPFDREPKVMEYVSDLGAVSSSADASNPHVQGAYVGAALLVDALERLGPAPTRAGLREILDQTSFESGLAPLLTFKPGGHFAAVSAQAFEAIFNGKSFNNWQHAQDFITDDEVRADLGKL